MHEERLLEIERHIAVLHWATCELWMREFARQHDPVAAASRPSYSN